MAGVNFNRVSHRISPSRDRSLRLSCASACFLKRCFNAGPKDLWVVRDTRRLVTAGSVPNSKSPASYFVPRSLNICSDRSWKQELTACEAGTKIWYPMNRSVAGRTKRQTILPSLPPALRDLHHVMAVDSQDLTSALIPDHCENLGALAFRIFSGCHLPLPACVSSGKLPWSSATKRPPCEGSGR
jgi:hypothetical protein